MNPNPQTNSFLPTENPNPFNLLTRENNNALENEICDQFSNRMHELYDRRVVLRKPTTKEVIVKRSIQSTRYHPDGQRKIKKRIHNRLGHYPATHGILLTLTIAGVDSDQTFYEGMERQDAWCGVGYKARDFLDRVNKLRKSRGLKKVKRYIKVLEEQPGRLYPHYHIWFPNLYHLADIKAVQKLWPYGNVDIKLIFQNSPAEYIISYISKMEGRSFMQAMIWHYRLRLYSTSRDYVYTPESKPHTGWMFSSSVDGCVGRTLIDLLLNDGYSFSGATLIRPRGS